MDLWNFPWQVEQLILCYFVLIAVVIDDVLSNLSRLRMFFNNVSVVFWRFESYPSEMLNC